MSLPLFCELVHPTLRKVNSSQLPSVLFYILEYLINCKRRGMIRNLSQLVTLLFDPVLVGFVYRKEFNTLKAVYSISSHSLIPTFGIFSTHSACTWISLLRFLVGVNWHPHWLQSHQDFLSIPLFCPKPGAQYFISHYAILCLFTRSALQAPPETGSALFYRAKWRGGKSRWVECMPEPYTFLYILFCLLT